MRMGVVHESQMPQLHRFTDPISAHIPLKIKDKIWAGEYIDLHILLKLARELATDSQLSGGLSIMGGQLSHTAKNRCNFQHTCMDIGLYDIHGRYARKMA